MRKIALLFGLLVAIVLVPAVPAFADYTPPSSVPETTVVTTVPTVEPKAVTRGALPRTGSSTDVMVKAAVVLVAGGAILLLSVTALNRRRVRVPV